jgi:hypothetical protein
MLGPVAEPDANRAREQLQASAGLDAALSGAGIPYWIFGGWAVDLWAERVTRDHDDIDAAAWRVDDEKVKRALLDAGWRHTPAENEVVGTRYTWRTVEVEFTFLEKRADGAVVIPVPGNEIVWTHEPFGDERRALDGVGARVIPLQLLRSGKETIRPGPEEAAKDRSDLAVLSDIPPS